MKFRREQRVRARHGASGTNTIWCRVFLEDITVCGAEVPVGTLVWDITKNRFTAHVGYYDYGVGGLLVLSDAVAPESYRLAQAEDGTRAVEEYLEANPDKLSELVMQKMLEKIK